MSRTNYEYSELGEIECQLDSLKISINFIYGRLRKVKRRPVSISSWEISSLVAI